MTVFPTWYTDKTTPIAWDKLWGYDSVWVANVNISVWDIGTANFLARDTDNLTEWTTNKYASTTNVNAAWATMNADTTLVGNAYFLDDDTMAWDDATKVASQQSIKAYVDTKWTDINWLTEEAGITDWDELMYYNGASNVKIDYTDLKSSILSNSNLSQVASVWTLTFDDVAQSNITINHTLWVVPTRLDFIFPDNATSHRVGHWADDAWTITSVTSFNDGTYSRVITTNEAIATFDDANNSNWERRVDSVSTTQVVLSYTIVFDWWSWTPTTETNVYVTISS